LAANLSQEEYTTLCAHANAPTAEHVTNSAEHTTRIRVLAAIARGEAHLDQVQARRAQARADFLGQAQARADLALTQFLGQAQFEPPQPPLVQLRVDEQVQLDCQWVKNPEEVARELLRSWLSPDQLSDYDQYSYFFVIGGATGTKYKIRDWVQLCQNPYYNVSSYKTDGQILAFICFEPIRLDGYQAWPVGDVLLTQKLALEQDELKTLMIANHKPEFTESRSSAYDQFITSTSQPYPMLAPNGERHYVPGGIVYGNGRPPIDVLRNAFENTYATFDPETSTN
jgi:hypothetical protein